MFYSEYETEECLNSVNFTHLAKNPRKMTLAFPLAGRKIGFIFGIPFSVSKNDKAVM